MFLKRSGIAIALLPILLAAGCSSVDKMGSDIGHMFHSDANAAIKIDSEPSGADVYVMGEKVGVTPLKIEQSAVFPTTYPKDKESLYGKVAIKKAGCSDFSQEVSAKSLAVGIKARLDCGDLSPATATGSRQPATADVPRLSESVEQRLKHIKDLLDQGLINEEEAKTARKHVIDDL